MGFVVRRLPDGWIRRGALGYIDAPRRWPSLAGQRLRPARAAARTVPLLSWAEHLGAALRRHVKTPSVPSMKRKRGRQGARRARPKVGRALRPVRAARTPRPAPAAPSAKVTDDEVLALRRAGLWSGDIATRTGLSRTAVIRRLAKLRRNGVAVPPPRGPRPQRGRPVGYEHLLTLVREGLPPAKIAARLGLSRHNVHHRLEVLRRHGLLAPGKRVASEILRDLVAEGLTASEIAARMGLRERHLRARLRSLGLIQPVRAAVSNAELLALRQAGLWASQIAARTGMTVGAVRRRLYLLRRRGVPVPLPEGPPPNPLRRVEDAALLNLARAGLRPAAIAPQVGLTASGVQTRLRSLRRRGLLGPPPPRVSLRRRPAVSPEELAYLRAHFREALRDDGVVCLECGAIRRSMGAHVRMHGLRIAAYRVRWEYGRQNPLVVPDLSELRRRLAIEHSFGGSAPPDALAKALAARRGVPSPHRLETRFDQREAARARLASGWRQPLLREKDETLRALVREGLTPRGIATCLGLRERHIRERIRQLRLEGPGIPPPRRKITDAELLALRQSGYWNVEIAARTGMRPGSVSGRLERLRKLGVAVPTPARPVPTLRRRASDQILLALVGQGLTTAEIAARVGLALSSVQWRLRALRRRGMLSPGPYPRRRARREGPKARLRSQTSKR